MHGLASTPTGTYLPGSPGFFAPAHPVICSFCACDMLVTFSCRNTQYTSALLSNLSVVWYQVPLYPVMTPCWITAEHIFIKGIALCIFRLLTKVLALKGEVDKYSCRSESSYYAVQFLHDSKQFRLSDF